MGQFLAALQYLHDKLNQGKIDYFFDENSNLLSKFNSVQITNMAGFLKKVIADLKNSQKTESCRTEWMKYFKN